MRKGHQRIPARQRHFTAAVWCALLLAVFLCGCKGKAKEDGTLAASGREEPATGSQAENGIRELPDGYALLPHFEDAGGESGMMSPHLIGNMLYYYICTDNLQRDTEQMDFYVQEQGKEAQNRLSFGKEDKNTLENMAVGPDGSVYFLYGEENADAEILSYTLEKRDKDMQVVYSVDTTAGLEGIQGIYGMEAAPDGTLYAVTVDGTVLCWDNEGAYQGRFLLPENMSTVQGNEICYGIANAGTSGIYVYWRGRDEEQNSDVLNLYHLEQWRDMEESEREKAEPLRVDFKSAEEGVDRSYGFAVFSGCEDGLYLADHNRLWRIDLADGSLKALLTWKDISLKADYVQAIRRREDGGFLIYFFDMLEQENYWVSLEAVPASQIPEKKELVLGVAGGVFGNVKSGEGQSLASDIEQVVLSYNRTHPDCHVTIREYEKSSVTKFQLELINGEGPDILLDREALFDMDMLAAKGAVEDLSVYLEQGREISAGDILPGIQELIMKNGKISSIPLSFAVDVVIVRKDAPAEIMTPQELISLMTQEEQFHVDYWSFPRTFLIQVLFGAEIDRYVDAENGSSSFDSGEFARLLETFAALDGRERMEKRWDRAQLFHDGKLPVMVQELNCLEDYFCIRGTFAGSVRIDGFPNSGRELRYPAKLYDHLGINSASKYKEEAWSFIEFCLSYTRRSDNIRDRFAVLKDKFEEQTRYESGDEDIFIWGNDYDDEWTGWQNIPSTTQEETDFLRGLAEHLYLYENPDLQQVIEEEADAFYEGDIDAAEAAKRIQNRAALVLGE